MRRALQEAFVPGRTAALFKGLVNLVRHESSPRPSFEERWQATENLSPEQQVAFAAEEIQALMKRVRKGRIPNTQARIPIGFGFGFGGMYSGGNKHMTRIDIGDIPEDSLPIEIGAPLRTHLNNRRKNPESWGGEPSLGLRFYIERGLGGGGAGIELTVDTVDSADGCVWAEEHQQGITVIAKSSGVTFGRPFETRVIKDDWGWPQSPSNTFDGLEEYARTTPPFQLMKTLARFAEGILQQRATVSSQ